MTSLKVGQPDAIRGRIETPPVRMVLEGIVQRLSLFGPGGNAPPSGMYLVLNKTLTVGDRTFDKVYLGPSDFQIGGQYVLQGDLRVVTKRGIPATIKYAVFENATKMEVEP
ncbi:MAG: hypothetical protein ACAI38_01330 [Myxococcota bacterium]|nr:hypothetical protein [Myxococcota bacterium]